MRRARTRLPTEDRVRLVLAVLGNEMSLAEAGRRHGVTPTSVSVWRSGPTGFGLARALTAAGWRCEVAASSKLHRPAGDRVKTDLLTELQHVAAGHRVAWTQQRRLQHRERVVAAAVAKDRALQKADIWC
jgi:hypothetical protein